MVSNCLFCDDGVKLSLVSDCSMTKKSTKNPNMMNRFLPSTLLGPSPQIFTVLNLRMKLFKFPF